MKKSKILITGGAGFIGTNAALFFGKMGWDITIVDDLSRNGVQSNLSSLKTAVPKLTFVKADVGDTDTYAQHISQASAILHLAGQTAVTTSLTDPQHDFNTNVLGTFRLLEATKQLNKHAAFLYSSTNKVYGDLHSHTLVKNTKQLRWENVSKPLGIDESEQLDFLSPYGVSKGSADQYVKDWAHSYGLNTVVFRQSCIYGPYQRGVEDQGWVAHFSKQILAHRPITVFGDGYQVRDLLHVHDLVRGYAAAIEQIETVRGSVFNIGGGLENAYSVRQILDILTQKIGTEPHIAYEKERLADQRYFVSANRFIQAHLGWQPTIKLLEGLDSMIDWQRNHLEQPISV
ncbi:MAG: NAD-dependent epimerase/dehydratase family protein [Candidatus Roizmanbacteria bacterium]